MDWLLEIIDLGIEGYTQYEQKEILKKQLENITKIITLTVVLFFTYKILKG